MNQFVLQQGKSAELLLFPHIQELGIKKNGSIQLNAFSTTITEGLRIYYIIEGRFEWRINHQSYIFILATWRCILPGTPFGSDNGVLEIGSFTWIQLALYGLDKGHLQPGEMERPVGKRSGCYWQNPTVKQFAGFVAIYERSGQDTQMYSCRIVWQRGGVPGKHQSPAG